MSFFNSLGKSMGRKGSTGPTSPTTPVPQSKGQGYPQPRSNNSNQQQDVALYSQPSTPKLFLSKPFVEASLVKGSLKTLVLLPKYLDVMEWVAMSMFDFYNNVNLFYGAVSEHCTAKDCPTMTAGDQLVYTWVDNNNKHVKLPASTYIDYVFTWIQALLEDQSIFPTRAGVPFPANFPSTCKHMYRQMLRVFAHLYQAHFEDILHLRIEPHLNSLFAHYLVFGQEFDILDQKELRGPSSTPTGIGYLYDAWRTSGKLD
ncbi:related to MOB2-required for maintenance in ploidy [Serendipita indica DSM 11827]|uniref:Related to MOB2-required for maintenance in ploidy n=1 Tax=Serendipita indica (strain DSM 11827) TaxID=1109443 RepID=G4U2X9_SERID|nr:related to MOB2-required for maintenance in ploidy [Serendipita indica DSM 11827]